MATGTGTPTGTVTFRDGATTLGNGTLSGNTATFATTALTAGGHSITAVYNGDANFGGSTTSPALTQTVNPNPNQGTTTTAVASSANPSTAGQSVTFTATVAVSTGTGTPTGTVTFRDGATTLGNGTLSGNTATFATTALTAGGHSITSIYNGDANFGGSTSPALTQTVNPSQGTTTTTIASSINPSTAGQPVTFTATVAVKSGMGTPTGTVNFNDGGTLIGTGRLPGNTATLMTSSLALGNHTINATYAGIANFLTSTSQALLQAVSTPTDNLKLRALQVLVTPTVAQVSGQAISGAIDSAIGEAFNEGGAFISPSAGGAAV